MVTRRVRLYVLCGQLDSKSADREQFGTDWKFFILKRRPGGRRSSLFARGVDASESVCTRRPGADLSSLQPSARFLPRSPKLRGELRANPNLVDV